MNSRLRHIATVKTLCGLFIGVAVFIIFLAKPLRVTIPAALGLYCHETLCVEHPADYPHAQIVYEQALLDVNTTVKKINESPRFIFCKSDACYKKFGGGAERAISYPYLGTILSGNSWQIYIVKHELIHWLQFQELGAIQTMRTPLWFREGMAYSLSGAPLNDVPPSHLPLMTQYQAWVQGRGNVWSGVP
jgi:hypothetical protein